MNDWKISDDRPALINCPACDREVSSNAASCPKCGEKIKEAQTATGFLAAILIALVVGGFLYWLIVSA